MSTLIASPLEQVLTRLRQRHPHLTDPLETAWCSLTSPVAITPGEGGNTEATLSVITPNEYYTGDLTVTYRRYALGELLRDLTVPPRTGGYPDTNEAFTALCEAYKLPFDETDIQYATLTAEATSIQFVARSASLGLTGSVTLPVGQFGIPDAPGPSTLIGGTMQAGFFGEVPTTELFSGQELASLVGLSEGSAINSTTPWLKFALGGKILYVAKRPYRAEVSWERLYQLGIVRGDGTPGPVPSGEPVVQDTEVTRSDYRFQVRLLTGLREDQSTDLSGYDESVTRESEWNRLIYPVHQERPLNQITTNWANYDDNDLGVHHSSGPGAYSWCQETAESDPSARLLRGHNGLTYHTWGLDSTTFANRGWRPVLELIPA